MPIFTPDTPSPALQYSLDLWLHEEVFRFYARERRANCNFLEIQNLWMFAPECGDCAVSRWDYRGELPDSTPDSWEEDLPLILGDDVPLEPAFECHSCGTLIEVTADVLYVVAHHLEEHFGVPLATPGRVWPSRRQQRQLSRVYGDRCFRCASTGPLHLDHIQPRSAGGDAAFRNLQPLCESCGQLKADQLPEEVTVYSTMYFTSPPSDSYEGMFW